MSVEFQFQATVQSYNDSTRWTRRLFWGICCRSKLTNHRHDVGGLQMTTDNCQIITDHRFLFHPTLTITHQISQTAPAAVRLLTDRMYSPPASCRSATYETGPC